MTIVYRETNLSTPSIYQLYLSEVSGRSQISQSEITHKSLLYSASMSYRLFLHPGILASTDLSAQIVDCSNMAWYILRVCFYRVQLDDFSQLTRV